MLNAEKIKNIIEIVEGLGYRSFAAGSSVYLNEGTATDIDVYVDFHKRDLTKFDDDLIDQLTMEGDFEVVERKPVAVTTAYASGCDFIKKVVSVEDNDGMIYDIIAVDLVMPTPYQFAYDVLSTFDYGRIQIGWTVQGFVTTDKYEKDITDQTLTLYHVYSKYHLKVMGKRIEKLQSRFPGHRIVITEDFYHEPVKPKRVCRNQYTKKPTGFLAQVAEAQRLVNLGIFDQGFANNVAANG